jgi:hypothetical protein
LLSLANMAGRIGWSSTSDYIGRKPTYMMYLGGGLDLHFVLALFGATSLVLFLLVTVVILSCYGGGFATVQAYLKDLFGVAQLGPSTEGCLRRGQPPESRYHSSSTPSPPTRRPQDAPERTFTPSLCTSWSVFWPLASSPTCWSDT